MKKSQQDFKDMTATAAAYKQTIINAIALIAFGTGEFIVSEKQNALVLCGIGVILIILAFPIKKGNKISFHVVVVLTLVAACMIFATGDLLKSIFLLGMFLVTLYAIVKYTIVYLTIMLEKKINKPMKIPSNLNSEDMKRIASQLDMKHEEIERFIEIQRYRASIDKEVKGDHQQQNVPPQDSSLLSGKNFESPITSLDLMLCSDNKCPCLGLTTLVPGITGYLHIREEVVKMRHDALSWEELVVKAKKIQEQHGAKIIFDNVNPILLCEQGARRLNLNLEVAAADAANWQKTGNVPLRVTPTITQ